MTLQAASRASRALAAGVFASALSCGGGDGAPDAGIADAAPPPPGEVELAWDLEDDGELVRCDEVDALAVSITVLPTDAFAGEVHTASCAVGGDGFPFELEPGAYTGRAELIASVGAIGESIELGRFEVESGASTELDRLTFEVPRRGGADFRVRAHPFDDNCEDDGTPPLQELRIQLEDREEDGACVPVTFDVAEGEEEEALTYESDCEGASLECVENDREISFSDVEPGRYRLRVDARDETDRCFGRAPHFRISGGGASTPLDEIVLDERDDCSAFDGGSGADEPDAGIDAGTDGG